METNQSRIWNTNGNKQQTKPTTNQSDKCGDWENEIESVFGISIERFGDYVILYGRDHMDFNLSL